MRCVGRTTDGNQHQVPKRRSPGPWCTGRVGNFWGWAGDYLAYKEGEDIWARNGTYLGRLVAQELFGPNGHYLAEARDDRLLVDTRKTYVTIAPFERQSDRSPVAALSDRAGYTLPYGYVDFVPSGTESSSRAHFETWARRRHPIHLLGKLR